MRLVWTLTLMLTLLVPPGDVRPAAAQPVAATLTVLAGSVSLQPAAGGPFAPATDGMDVANGDRVKTEADSTALITFVDGTAVTVQPETEITVNRTGGANETSRTSIRVILGTVWARVVKLFDAQSEFVIEGQSATATVRGSEIGAQQNADGSFVCWTRSGHMTVSGFGQSLTLEPGQATTVAPGQAPTARPFAVNQSVLRATTPAPVFPLMATPTPELLAGFAAPGIVVSQVFGSYVSEGGSPRVIEVPAGRPGRYSLVVEGERETDFRIDLVAAHGAETIATVELTGRARPGERLIADISTAVDHTTDPRTARITAIEVSDFRPLDGPPPGKLVLAPAEVRSSGG